MHNVDFFYSLRETFWDCVTLNSLQSVVLPPGCRKLLNFINNILIKRFTNEKTNIYNNRFFNSVDIED